MTASAAPRHGRLATAAVTVGPGRTELRALPVPVPGADAALLEVEAAGVCGSDAWSYLEDLPARVMGHENVGRLTAVGELAASRWGLADGDRVLLEEYLPCGHCLYCRTGEFRSCLASDTSVNSHAVRFGSTPLAVAPGLWGGYSQVMYVHPSAVPHKVADDVPAHLATLGLPLGNGYQWVCLDGRARPGELVVIMGAGQAGIGCVVAAKEAGAHVVVIALARDAQRLEVARALGADATLVADAGEDGKGDVARRFTALTGGAQADLVVDAAAGDDETVALAVSLARKRGRIVLAAASRSPLSRFPVWAMSRKQLELLAVRGHGYASVEWALALITAKRRPIELMSTFLGALGDVDRALRDTAGANGSPILHATIVP